MTEQLNISLTISKDEALVLFEFLTKFNQKEHPEIFEDQAEQKTLWIIDGLLEKQLVETLHSNYKALILRVRNRIRNNEL